MKHSSSDSTTEMLNVLLCPVCITIISVLVFASETNGQFCMRKFVNGKWHKIGNCKEILPRVGPKSCRDILHEGETRSGVYKIQPTQDRTPFKVYCDLESAGGGWTLVASVHENNIQGRCSHGDKWSSEKGSTNKSSKGSGNWANSNTFGTVENVTSNDYKNPAYFNIQALDVMMWHVPNDVGIQQVASNAFLKYYTKSGFLKNHGGTLHSLFSRYYTLTKVERQGMTSSGVTNLLAAFNHSASTIRSLIPSFYSYIYDRATLSLIDDGGLDMFDGGNAIYYRIGDVAEVKANYNITYRSGREWEFRAATSHPFIAMLWIGNQDGRIAKFSIKLQSA